MAGTYLEDILASRRRRLEERRARTPLRDVQSAAERRPARRNFAAALAGSRLSVIAEVKKASPSRGLLREPYRCREIAQGYEVAGAAALSVLTEEQFFQGSLTDLMDARDGVGLPVLRKDFILDDYQVYESVAAGADALLLIVAGLPDSSLKGLLRVCERLEIDALVEVHTADEVTRAVSAGARIIGVNNRDLHSFEVSLETSFRLVDEIPAEFLAVSESGIKTAEDLYRLWEAGYDAALIGERLLTAPDPGIELAAMLEGYDAAARQTTRG